jgi:hypothetical protein
VKTVPDAGYLATEGVTDPRDPAIAKPVEIEEPLRKSLK